MPTVLGWSRMGSSASRATSGLSWPPSRSLGAGGGPLALMLAIGYLIIRATAGRDSGEKCNAP
jgi:hypothetical protein